MKDVRIQGGCPVRTFFGQGEGGFLQMRTSALFGAKKLRIFRKFMKFMVCPHGQGEGG